MTMSGNSGYDGSNLFRVLMHSKEHENGTRSPFFYTVDGDFDIHRMGELSKQLNRLGIAHGWNNWMVGFKSESELNEAMKKVWNSDWNEKWAIKKFLVKIEYINEQGALQKKTAPQKVK